MPSAKPFIAIVLSLSATLANAEELMCPARELVQGTELMGTAVVESASREGFAATGFVTTEDGPWVVISGAFEESQALALGQSLLLKAQEPRIKHEGGTTSCVYYFSSHGSTLRFITAVPYKAIRPNASSPLHGFA